MILSRKGLDGFCAPLLWRECPGALQAYFACAAQLEPFHCGDGREAVLSEHVGLCGLGDRAQTHTIILPAERACKTGIP